MKNKFLTKKINLILKILKQNKCNAFISTSDLTRKWLFGLDASFGILVISNSEKTFFTNPLYYEEVKRNVQKVSVKNFSLKEFKINKYKNILLEEDTLLVNELNLITKYAPNSKIKYINSGELRIIKNSEEIKNLKTACKISLKALSVIKKQIKPGMTENEIKNLLIFKMREFGGSDPSFLPIVLSGTRTSMPHGKPSNKKIKDGELITIDFGIFYNHFASDITRSFFIGKTNNSKMKEIFNVVSQAQQKGIQAIKPGISTNQIDAICRDYITKKGYGKFFVHSTGHGLGIAVHELPVVTPSKKVSTILKEGMVITVEPGIYIPGLGGVRIEDDILVTKKGFEVLSKE